jgi:uncharacterized protein (TIGR02246 family)
MKLFRPAVLLSIVLVTLTLSSGCWRYRAVLNRAEREQLEQQRIAAAQDAIRTASADSIRAAQAKDLEKTLSYYAPNAVMFGAGAPMQGIEGIRKVWQQLLAAPNLQMKLTTISVEVARSGDLGWEYGSFESTSSDSKGKPVTQKGKYVVIWKLQPDGSWKIGADTSANDK